MEKELIKVELYRPGVNDRSIIEDMTLEDMKIIAEEASDRLAAAIYREFIAMIEEGETKYESYCGIGFYVLGASESRAEEDEA